MTGPYGHAWEGYRAAGWNGVIPLPPRKKAHPPRGTTGADGIWPSYADCMAWADGAEAAGNIALRLPHSVLGVDVDNYDGKPGAATIAAAEHQWGTLPPTWRTTSRNDGVSGIRLYRVPEGLAWPGEVGPATELIQYRHRYAVVWPSTHPDTGGTYQWHGPDGTPSAIPDADQLPELPAAWIEGLTRGAEATASTPRNNWSSAQVQQWLLTRPRALEEPCPRMRRALDDARLRLAAGASAHDTTVSAVMRTVRLADEGHAGAVSALGQLHAAFTGNVTAGHRAGHTRTLGQAEHEWRSALEGAVSKVSATTTGLDVCDCDGRITNAIVAAAGPPLPGPSAHTPQPDPAQPQPDPQPTPQPAPDPFIEDQIKTETLKIQIRDEARRRARRAQAGAQAPPEPVTLTDFLAIPDDPQQYRIEGLWPVGGRVMLSAQFKSGKTTMTGNLVRALVDGQPFLDRFMTRPPTGRVAIIDDELDDRMLRRWLRDQAIINTAQVVVIPLRGRVSTFDLLDPDTRHEWATRIRATGSTMVVLDCLAPILDALGLSEDKEAGRFLVALDEFAKAAAVEEIVLVHHMGHNTERARGASRLRDWPDVEWKLTREKAEEGEDNPAARRYFSAYGRDVDVAESALDYDPATRRLTLSGGSRKDAAGEGIRDAVVAYLRTNPGSSGRQVELFSGSPQKKTRAALKQLVAEKLVTEVVHSGGMLYSVAPPPTPALGNPLAEVNAQINGTPRQASATPRQHGGEGLGSGPPYGGRSALAEPPTSATNAPPKQTMIDGRIIDTGTGEDLGPAT